MLISALLNITAIISLFILFHISSQHYKRSPLCRVFLLYVLTSLVWAFFEFQTKLSETEQRYLFWENFNVLWYYSIFIKLHFILHFTEHYALLKSTVFRFTIYFIPGLLAYLDFVFIKPVELYQTYAGFYPVYTNLEGLFYKGFILLFSIIGFILIFITWRYYSKQSSKARKKQALIVLVSLIPTSLWALFIHWLFPVVNTGLYCPSLIQAYVPESLILIFAVLSLDILNLHPVIAQYSIEQALSDALFAVDRSGKILYTNKQANRLTQQQPHVLQQLFIHDLFPAQSASALYPHSRYTDKDFRLKTAAGKLLPVSISSSTLNKGKHLSGYVFIVRDRQEKARREKELKASRDYIEQLFQQTPAAIFTLDENHCIQNWNRRAFELSGYHEDEILTHTISQIFPGIAIIAKKFSLQQTMSIRDEIEIQNKNGQIRIIHLNLEKLEKENNTQIIIGSFIDITASKELDKQKENMNRVLQHDLKGPLTAVLGYTAILMDEKNFDDDSLEMLHAIQNAGSRMNKIITRALTILRVEEQQFTYKPQKTNITVILKNTLDDLNPFIWSSRVTIHCIVSGRDLVEAEDLYAKTDSLLLYSVLSNLVKNAVEASKLNSFVKISVWKTNFLNISVQNDSPIPEKIRNKFFEKFSTEGKSSGVGLGTYSSKLFTEIMGGSIHFESSEQEGTVVHVELPQ